MKWIGNNDNYKNNGDISIETINSEKLKLLEMNIDGKLNFEHKPWVNNNQKLCLCKFEHFSF